MLEITKEDIQIICADKVSLAATLYTPANKIKAAIMLAPATGIKRRFYNFFAIYLAEKGFAVITFDNRGIGESLGGKLKDCKASLQEWGELDMTAVLEEVKRRFPDTQYHLIGHSAGGQLVGLMPNAQELTSMFNFACSSGRINYMTFPYYLTANFFMRVFIPMSNTLLGYTNTKWVGMGEPLPKHIASQWKKWCCGKGYVQTDFGKSIKTHCYDTLDTPSMWVNASDDNIANDKTVDDMLQVFSKLNPVCKTLNPKDYGIKEIGHMKFFTKRNIMLWELALDWLEGAYKERI